LQVSIDYTDWYFPIPEWEQNLAIVFYPADITSPDMQSHPEFVGPKRVKVSDVSVGGGEFSRDIEADAWVNRTIVRLL